MKILITGTNGFIGRNLKEYLQVRYEDIDCPKRAELDLLDQRAVETYLTAKGPDVVLHCAVTLLAVEPNVKMYSHLERCSSAFGKMLSVGSGAEYDMKHYVPRMKEDYFGQHVPSDIYGLSKYTIAKDIETKRKNIYNFRGFGIYGKYENYRRRFISNNICRLLSGAGLSINKNMYFDYLYIDDFARMVDLFMHKSPSRHSLNACTGRPIDLLTLAKIIRAVDGKNRPIEIKEEGLGVEYSGDNTLFLEEYGPFDFTEHEKAIDELYRWYKDQSLITLDINDFK